MIRFFGRLRRFLGTILSTIAPFIAVLIGLFVINSRLPDGSVPELRDAPESYLIAALTTAAFLLTLVIVSTWYIVRKSDSDARAATMVSDRLGTLFNGNEPNISFRVRTFNHLVQQLAGALDEEDTRAVFEASGRSAAYDFAGNIEGILTNERKLKTNWRQMNLAQKLEEWADYDSHTGWGKFTVSYSGEPIVIVKVTHIRGLLSGDGGQCFAGFLAGYSETVITRLVNQQNIGSARPYSRAKLVRPMKLSNETAQLTYQLV